MALSDITKPAVDLALAEHDKLGGPGFLDKYGFGNARAYWLVNGGKRYPSKAIAGVAHKFLPGQGQLTPQDFHGGENTVAKRLRKLGFTVEGPGRNPDWTRDEMILALDLYLSNPASPPRQNSAEVGNLSRLLNKLHRLTGTIASATLRNSNGVYLKMMNLRALDPNFTTQGKVGMRSGVGDLEREVWNKYQGKRQQLSADARAIRESVETADEKAVAKLPNGEPYEGEEGGVIVRLHKRYERDPKLVAAKRKEALSKGDFRCEVCKFDYRANYGELGAGYIEVHHVNALHQLKKKGKTKLSDLALLCANCHRMAHRKRIPLSLEELAKAKGRASV
jgi:5-methylcytosine-specific restriction enzyme A